MDTELFDKWFKNHAPPASRPLLLLLDSHSSHYQPDLAQAASAEGVIMLCLPPHITHILQPLDMPLSSCRHTFGSLKRQWGEECHRFCTNNLGKVVNWYNGPSIFNSAWLKGCEQHHSELLCSRNLPIEKKSCTITAHWDMQRCRCFTP